jgi:hypothetical protein
VVVFGEPTKAEMNQNPTESKEKYWISPKMKRVCWQLRMQCIPMESCIHISKLYVVAEDLENNACLFMQTRSLFFVTITLEDTR